MTKLLLWMMGLLSFSFGYTQTISDIRIELNKPKRNISIIYDLNAETKLQTKQVFDVEVYVSQNNGRTYAGPLEYVRGSTRQVTPGINNRIEWNFYPEMPEFGSDSVVFKLVGKLNQTAEDNRIIRLGTAGSVWQSVLMPGWGSSKVQGTPIKWWIGASAYTLVGAGAYFQWSSDRHYQDYKNNQIPDQSSDSFRQAKAERSLSHILLISGGAIWLGDMVYTLIRGNQNQTQQREILARKSRTAFRWSPLSPQGLGATVQWRF
jgi:hypothetical protein